MDNFQGPYGERVSHLRARAKSLADARASQASLIGEIEATIAELFEEAGRIFVDSPSDAITGRPFLEIVEGTDAAPRGLRIGQNVLYFAVGDDGKLSVTSNDVQLKLPTSAGEQSPHDLARIKWAGSAEGNQCTLVFETGPDSTGTIQFLDLVAQLLGAALEPAQRALREAQRRGRG